jgi:hypothetical protein
MMSTALISLRIKSILKPDKVYHADGAGEKPYANR